MLETAFGKISGINEIKIWGDGTPLREFLHVQDLATSKQGPKTQPATLALSNDSSTRARRAS